MFDNLEVTIRTILALLGGATVLIGGVSSITKLFSPLRKLKEQVERNVKKLDSDHIRMTKFDEMISEVEDTNKVICKCLLVLLNHEITGNGTEDLKKQRDELQLFLVNK